MCSVNCETWLCCSPYPNKMEGICAQEERDHSDIPRKREEKSYSKHFYQLQSMPNLRIIILMVYKASDYGLITNLYAGWPTEAARCWSWAAGKKTVRFRARRSLNSPLTPSGTWLQHRILRTACIHVGLLQHEFVLPVDVVVMPSVYVAGITEVISEWCQNDDSC